MYSTRREFLKYAGATLLAGSIALSPLEEVVADTSYYGSYKPREEQKVAYIEYNKLASESKHTLPPKNDPRYNFILNQRNMNISNAITDVAGNFNGEYEVAYDVVVEKDDPRINGYVDITQKVAKRLKEIEV